MFLNIYIKEVEKLEIKQYDTVKLKDGRVVAIVEILSEEVFLADIGESEKDWDTIEIKKDDILEVCL